MSFLAFYSKEHLIKPNRSSQKCAEQYISMKFYWYWGSTLDPHLKTFSPNFFWMQHRLATINSNNSNKTVPKFNWFITYGPTCKLISYQLMWAYFVEKHNILKYINLKNLVRINIRSSSTELYIQHANSICSKLKVIDFHHSF